jgi:hypothetical protein
MSTHAKKIKKKKMWRHVVSTASAICWGKPEHLKLKPYGNPWRICHVIDLICELETSLLMRGIQIGEMFRLVWLIGVLKYVIWADSLYFLYLLVLSVSKILVSSHPTLWIRACGANFNFSRRPSLRLCVCSVSSATTGLLQRVSTAVKSASGKADASGIWRKRVTRTARNDNRRRK